MKRTLVRFLKYVLFTITGIVLCIVAGLLIYYYSLYHPAEVRAGAPFVKPVAEISKLSDKPLLLPVPKNINWTQGHFRLDQHVKLKALPADLGDIERIWNERLKPAATGSASSGDIQFVKDNSLPPQAYRLSINPQSIKIKYSTMQGAFYSLSTLKLIAEQSASTLPCVEIEDEPDLNTRGAMIDISRGKVPKLETLFELVDLLADLKYTQFQLYVEGFSFGYPSFKRFWEKTETPLLPEEIRRLDAYCRQRFIELVPNQNSLGHMQDWLKQPELMNLAECPEGYKLLGLIEMKTTISPTNPRSLELVEQMSEDLLPNFSSNQFNVNLDEPFELGKSKQRPIEDPKEIGRLYLDYARKLNDYVKSRNKTMMMWGDVVSRSPEVINEIPKDITLLEWRYEDIMPFDKICQKYQQAGLRYLVCPGTSTWSSFTGRTNNMLRNIESAVESGVKYGAEGALITDWGDTPHLQYLTVSYPALTYMGALTWNVESKGEIPLDGYLSQIVFRDSTRTFGNLVMDLGRYNQFEEHPMIAMTSTNMALRFGMMDPVMINAIAERLRKGIPEIAGFDPETLQNFQSVLQNTKPYDAQSILNYVSSLGKHLSLVRLDRKDGALIVDEYKNAIRMIVLSTLLKQYILFHLEQTDDQNRTTLNEMKTLCANVISEHQRLWMQRNKRSGYKGSIETFEKLSADIDAQLELLNSNVLKRWAKRTTEKMIAAATALYLK